MTIIKFYFIITKTLKLVYVFNTKKFNFQLTLLNANQYCYLYATLK